MMQYFWFCCEMETAVETKQHIVVFGGGKTAKSLPVQRQQRIDGINEWIDFKLNRFGILSSLLVAIASINMR